MAVIKHEAAMFPTQSKLFLQKLREQLWFLPALWSLLATGGVLFAHALDETLPVNSLPDVSEAAITDILKTIAASMLAISTFSLSILYTAFSTAAGATTPRAARLVVQDRKGHQAISSFIAAFIFSITGFIGMGMGYYGPVGRFVLLLETLATLAAVILALLRWVQTLSVLGSTDDTIAKVEASTSKALRDCRENPFYGCVPGSLPEGRALCRLHAAFTGYIESTDMKALDKLAGELDGVVNVLTRPGDWAHPGLCLAVFSGPEPLSDSQREALEAAFTIKPERSFCVDPRFGLVVLAEIAQRALPGDPGTAVNALDAATRVILGAFSGVPDSFSGPASGQQTGHVTFPRVALVPPDYTGYIRSFFDPLSRDGAALYEVALRIQKSLAALAAGCAPEVAVPARSAAWRAYERAARKLEPPDPVERLKELAETTAGTDRLNFAPER